MRFKLLWSGSIRVLGGENRCCVLVVGRDGKEIPAVLLTLTICQHQFVKADVVYSYSDFFRHLPHSKPSLPSLSFSILLMV